MSSAFDEDNTDYEEVERIKNELMNDSSLFGMHWRDFDKEAMQIYLEGDKMTGGDTGE
jgi:hypothetical protein